MRQFLRTLSFRTKETALWAYPRRGNAIADAIDPNRPSLTFGMPGTGKSYCFVKRFLWNLGNRPAGVVTRPGEQAEAGPNIRVCEVKYGKIEEDNVDCTPVLASDGPLILDDLRWIHNHSQGGLRPFMDLNRPVHCTSQIYFEEMAPFVTQNDLQWIFFRTSRYPTVDLFGSVVDREIGRDIDEVAKRIDRLGTGEALVFP